VTFSLAARCERTGAFGACAATADIAVGARVAHVEAGVGAILTQHRTDPRLGPRGLELLRSGCDASETIAALVASTSAAHWRQLAAVDAAGACAAFSGSAVVTTSAERYGPGCVAIGNMLASQDVASAMVRAFTSDTRAPLAARLVRALEGGAAAGGETGITRSAVVLVAFDPGMRLVDLRVDDDPAPIDAMRRLWTAFQPWTDDLRLRALEPDRARGVPEAAERAGGRDR
jgi:uncharacterized Ntn-hydrolase superfamily protein